MNTVGEPDEGKLHVRFDEGRLARLRPDQSPTLPVFDGVKLRTNGTKRMKVRENALYLVFKLVCRLSTNWRSINAPNQLTLLLAGHPFVDGKLQLEQSTQEGIAA